MRKRRNVEIHNMNSELQDDLMQMHLHFGSAVKLENIGSQMADANAGLEMATASLQLVFAYVLAQNGSASPAGGR